MQRLTELALRRPGAVLALAALLTLALGAGLPRLRTETGYRAFLGPRHPAVRALDEMAERFGGGVPFLVVWSCATSPGCERALDPHSLAMAHDVATALEALPGVLRVDGPATSPLLVQEPLELPKAVRLAPEGRPTPDLDRLASQARADPLWRGQIVSADGRAGALVVHLADSRGALAERVLDALRAHLARWERQGFRFALVGGPVEFVVAGRELDRDARTLTPLIVGLVALVLAALFRAPGAAAVALGTVGLALLWTLGLQGWLGWPRNSFSQVLPPLLLVIGVCDTVHLMAAYGERLSARGGEGAGRAADRAARKASLAEAARRVATPCLYTSLTTAAGFASFAGGELQSLARFGLVAAFGVLAALLTTFAMVPLVSSALPARWMLGSRRVEGWGPRGARLAGWVARRRGAVLAAAAALLALGVVGATRLQVEARFEDLYGEQSQVVRWAREASAWLRPAETLEVAVELPAGVGPADPRALRVLRRVEALAELEGLERPLSVLALMRTLNDRVHHEPLALDGPEVDAERLVGLQRLLRLEEPELLGLFARRAGDGRRAALRVVFQAGKLPQAELRTLLRRVDARLALALPPGYGASVAGPLATVGRMLDAIRATQLRSFAFALAAVGALVALLFRSLRFGALALVPTLLPVVLTLGVMGAAGVPLDVGTAMVAAVILGLAVDDAIHLLAAIRRHEAGGAPPAAATVHGLSDVCGALVTTSAALAAGFLAIALMPWHTLAEFGGVCALAIAGALASDLLVLPALCFSLRGRRAAGPPPP